MRKRTRPTWTEKKTQDYEKLVAWLEAHGESMEAAEKDVERFKQEFRRLEAQQIEQRNRREKK